MKKKYITPEFSSEPLETRYGFLTGSAEGYDTDPFDPGFIMDVNTEWL